MIIEYDRAKMRKESYYSNVTSKMISAKYREYAEILKKFDAIYKKTRVDFYCWFDWKTGEYYVGNSPKNYTKWASAFPYTRKVRSN